MCPIPGELAAVWASLPTAVHEAAAARGVCIYFQSTVAFTMDRGHRAGREHYGIASPWSGELAVSPTVPEDRRRDVLLHEFGHLMEPYRSRWVAGIESGWVDDSPESVERDVDRFACTYGATWVHYLGSC